MEHISGRNKLEYYVNGCCRFGDFTLTSGKKSDFYVDIKSLMFESEPLFLLGEALCLHMERIFGDVDCVGGMELGSIPLTSSMSIYAHAVSGFRHNLPHFVIRKQPRTHGTKSQIEGECRGSIILIDDVLTSGGSLTKAANILREEGHTVSGGIVVVDRQEAGVMDFPVTSLFTKSQLKALQDD